MPTSLHGVPTTNDNLPKKNERYDLVAKHASEALDALVAFDETGCVACRQSDLGTIKTRTEEYVQYCQVHCTMPTITGLATRLGISRRTINEWIKDGNYPDTQQYLRVVKNTFADLLEQGALTGSIDKIFSMFLLKSTHDYQETNKIILEPQNNQYGEELTDEQIEEIIEDE